MVLPFSTALTEELVRLKVGGNEYQSVAEVVQSDGCQYVVLNLAEVIAEGQINPYVGPIEVLFNRSFIGPDGNYCDSISFQVANISGPGSDTGTINIFGVPNFEPYV